MASTNEKGESRGRGFAGMDPERQRQISSQGGKAAHQKGTAHEFDSNEAREAGRKGGMVSGGRRRAREQAHSRTRAVSSGARSRASGESESEEQRETSSTRRPRSLNLTARSPREAQASGGIPV